MHNVPQHDDCQNSMHPTHLHPVPLSCVQQMSDQRSSFNAQETCNTAWALATLGTVPEDQWVAALLKHAVDELADFQARHMAMLMGALARWQFVKHGWV